MEILDVFEQFHFWVSQKTLKLCAKTDTLLTSPGPPLAIKKATNTNCFLSILLLQKEDLWKRSRGPPEFPEIAKGLPVKDVEQKLMILVFFGVARKGPYCFPSRTESKNHRFGRFGKKVRKPWSARVLRSAAWAHAPIQDTLYYIMPYIPYAP